MDLNDYGDPVKIPITDVLDLHTFRPKDVPDLLNEYFAACIEKGIRQVRVIHGKGKGILKQRVYSILKRHPLVVSYMAAPPEGGGWGAVLVVLKAAKEKKES